MAKAFLFHNPRCSKSRQALNLLEKEKENFEVFMYLDEKLEKDFLKEIIQKLGMSPRDLLRTGESCLLYTSPSPRDRTRSRMPSSA